MPCPKAPPPGRVVRKIAMKSAPVINRTQTIYALRHINSGEFICLLQDGTDYLASFSDGDSALEFRAALGLQEHVDMVSSTLEESPFRHFWLDGDNVQMPHSAGD